MSTLPDTFAALADPTRLEIVARLAGGEATVSELVAHFDLTQPTISSHIKVLESAGLVSRSREAQTRPCRLRPEQLKRVSQWLARLQDVWEGNYRRLDTLLSQLKNKPTDRKQ